MTQAAVKASGWPQAAGRRSSDAHSRLVDLLKYLLPASALVLILLVALWPQLIGSYGGLIAPLLDRQLPATEAMRMHEARYVGMTREAKPYEVTAVSAYMNPMRPNRVQLDSLAADIPAAGSRDVHIVAPKGTYFRANGKLDLGGGIVLTTSDGYRFQTESAMVNLAGSQVVGSQPVAGRGPAGKLSADRFEIQEGGKVLRFEGRVKVTLKQTGAGGQ
jgi:lipopolysaccharide export system protein LptC